MRYLLLAIALPFAVFAAPDDTAVANRKWVRETLRQYATGTAVQDDELHCDGTNIWVNVLEEENGVLVNRPYYFDFEVRTVAGDRSGAVVVQTDNPQVPVGTFFAACAGPVLCNREKSLVYSHPSGGTIDIGPLFSGNIAEDIQTDQRGTYTNYSVSAAYTASISNTCGHALLTVRREVTCIPSGSRYLDLTETISLSADDGWSDARSYHYRIDGTRIPDDTFSRISGGAANYRWGWSDLSGHVSSQSYLLLRQRTDTAARVVPWRSLFIPSAFAGDSVMEIVSPLPLRSMPVVDFVDAFSYAYNGETKDTHWPLPDDYVPSREQWYDPMRWFQSYPADPFPMVIKVDITLGNGQVLRNKPTRINSVKALMDLGARIITSDWIAPTFQEKEEQCAQGHIYGADCVCIVCKTATREHSYAFDHVLEGQCARCVHQHDGWKTDRFGVKIPNGRKLEEVCNAHNTTSGDLALHRGWRASEHPDDDRYYCDCECGFYHAVEPLQHSIPAEDDIATWTDLGDGVHHYADLECRRECGGAHRVLRPHTPDIETELPEGEERKYEPHNAEEHLVWAACSASGCTFVGWTPEEHAFSPEDPCWCEKCETRIHDWEDMQCGTRVYQRCARCHQSRNKDGSAVRHEYGIPILPDDARHEEFAATHHTCFCGLGELEEHVMVNGVCRVCGYESNAEDKQYHRCRFKSQKNGKENTDLNHTESNPGEFPDNPQNANGTSCDFCERRLEDDIPESHKKMIRENFGCDPISVTNCYSGYAYKRTLTKDQDGNEIQPISYNMADMFYPLIEHSQLLNIAEAENAMFSDTIPKIGMSNLLFVYQLYYPYKIENTSILTNSIPFIRNARVRPKNNYVYGNLTYSGKIIEDKNSKQIGVKWF